MQLSFSDATLQKRLDDLEGLEDPVPFFHETSGWTQIKADEHGLSRTYFERVFEIVQENIVSWLSLDFDAARLRLQNKRTNSFNDKKLYLESLNDINQEYGELRELLLSDESFDEVSFSEKLNVFVSKIEGFSSIANCNYQQFINRLEEWKINKEDMNQDLSELPEAVSGYNKITFLNDVEDVNQKTFGSHFNDKYQKLKAGNWDKDAFEELNDRFKKVELHIASGEFKKNCPKLLNELGKWGRKHRAESEGLEELPKLIPGFDDVYKNAVKVLSEEEAMELVFRDEECLEQCFKTLEGRYAAGELGESALRVLDLHRLFTLIFRDQATAMDETPGKEICLSSEDENSVDLSHPYYSIAEENKVVFSGINAVAQTILSRKDLISTVASPLSDCKLWSNREISPIADCWKSGGVLQRLLSTIKMIVQVYIQFPAALNFWKNKANGCEDHEVKGKLELFAKGYDEFPSLDKKFCWITQAAGKQEGINVSMHRVLQEILDPQEKAFDIDDFKFLAGSDYVTFEEMDKMREWVRENVNPVNEAMGQLQDFFVNATEYTLGLIPKTQKAPLPEFKEKARAVYNACKEFEKGFATKFPEPSQA